MSNARIEVNFDKLEMLAGEEPEFMIEILEMIVEESPEVRSKMDSCFSSSSHDELASTAHKFKSSVNVLGHPVIDKLLKDIENTASGKLPSETESLSDLMDQFHQTCDVILEQIQQKLEDLKA
ncbi:MAG: Hpt domain-containing protein [Bacteroidota bacterium]